MSPREALAQLVDQYRLGGGDLEDLALSAFQLGIQALDQELARAQGKVFRVVDTEGKAVDRRAWASSGPAKLALRCGYLRGSVQEGTVFWKENADGNSP